MYLEENIWENTVNLFLHSQCPHLPWTSILSINTNDTYLLTQFLMSSFKNVLSGTKVQPSSYKINKLWDVTYSMVTILPIPYGTQSSLGIQEGLVPGAPTNTEFYGCSSPFHKMAKTMNRVGPPYPQVLRPQIQSTVDGKPTDTDG